MSSEVFGEILDSGGKKRDLHFRSSGVGFTAAKLLHDLHFPFFGQHDVPYSSLITN
jgi:hypothetical protein